MPPSTAPLTSFSWSDDVFGDDGLWVMHVVSRKRKASDYSKLASVAVEEFALGPRQDPSENVW